MRFDKLYILYSDDFAGKEVNEQFLDAMVNEAPGAINFTMFLTLFGEKLTGLIC